MKRLLLSAILVWASMACSAQVIEDTVLTIRIKKNKKVREPVGIVTVGGMYYGRMQVDAFLQHDNLIITQDNGKLRIISFLASAATRGAISPFSSSSSKIPPALKESIKQEGSAVYFEDIKAAYDDGTIVTLNPIIIKLYDVATGDTAATAAPSQSRVRATATVCGIRDGSLTRDSLLICDDVLIMGDEQDITLVSYDVQFTYKGTFFTMTSQGPLPADLKKLLSQPQVGISHLTFENIKAKRAAGDTVVLNPVMIRLQK